MIYSLLVYSTNVHAETYNFIISTFKIKHNFLNRVLLEGYDIIKRCFKIIHTSKGRAWKIASSIFGSIFTAHQCLMVSFYIWFNSIGHEHEQVIAEVRARQIFPYRPASVLTCNTPGILFLGSSKWSLPVILNSAKLHRGFVIRKTSIKF